MADYGVHDMRKTLRTLKNLQVLNMGFSRCKKITDKILIDLVAELRTLRRLKTLNLEFFWYKIEEK